MSNVWRKTITQHTKDGKRVPSGTPESKTVRSKTKRFYGTLRTADGKQKQIPLTDDRETSSVFLTRLQADEDRCKVYGVDQYQRERQKPLTAHLHAYEKYLRSKGNTDGYVVQQLDRIRELIRATKAKTLDDLDGHRIGQTLVRWRQRGRVDTRKGRKQRVMSVSTSNHYMRAVKGFSRWVWIEKRTSEDILRNLRLMNTKAHRTRERRALTSQELRSLVETTETCRKSSHGLRAGDRAALYLTAAYTGLRASELASLTVSSFDMEAKTVTVEAAYSKRRRKDVLPLHPSLIDRLSPWLKSKRGRVWKAAWSKDGAKMLRRDLKRAGIDYVDGTTG